MGLYFGITKAEPTCIGRIFFQFFDIEFPLFGSGECQKIKLDVFFTVFMLIVVVKTCISRKALVHSAHTQSHGMVSHMVHFHFLKIT